MKKLLIALPALLAVISFNLNSQWQTYQVTPFGRFLDVSVVSSSLIWASGDSAKVYRTTNGGVSWQFTGSGMPNITFNRITALDSNNAWVTSVVRIFRTTNGGQNWTEQTFNPITFINKIHFFNVNTGYLISDQAGDTLGFFVTRNGGLNWIRSPNAPVFPLPSYFVRDNGPSQTDTNYLWFFSERSGGNSTFYKLTGGLNNTWQSFEVSQCQCDMAVFKNSSEGIAVDGNNIYSTTNGGINWTLKLNGSAGGPTCDFIIVPGTDWVVHNTITNSRLSYDFCNSWQPIRSYSMLNFSDARDTNSIWISGSSGQLLKYNIGYIGINPLSTEVPASFKLYQNYPNPFNPQTKIKFDLPKAGDIKFKVYDINGKVVYELNEQKSAGVYEVTFDGLALASGVYYYSIKSEGFTETKKMVLLK